MSAGFETFVAVRYLRSRRRASVLSFTAAISLIGIGLGVAVLIIVMSIMNGLRHDLLSRILGIDPQIWVEQESGAITDYEPVVQRLLEIDGTIQAVPAVQGEAMLNAAGRATGVTVRGIAPEDLSTRAGITGRIVEGSLDSFGRGDGIVIGADLARSFGLRVGLEVTLISPSVSEENSMPRSRKLPIIAVFRTRYEFDSMLVFLPLETARQYYGLPGAVSGIDVTLADPQQAPAVADAVRAALGPGYIVRDWQNANASLVSALKVERVVTFLLLGLVVLVAAFNIIAGQIMLVKDKAREIAILRTMGAARSSILRVFMLSGAGVGVIGALCGVIIGVAVAYYVEDIGRWLEQWADHVPFSGVLLFLSRLPSIIEPWEVTAVAIAALLLSLSATLYPAWRAARLDPVEALRYE